MAMPPEPKNVHAGTAGDDIKEKVGKEGARTVPGRPEHGGNCDIKNLSRGSKVYLPVHVKGAKFSVGDLHFSQGDGEISFCGAIEMAGVITINFSVMKGGMEQLAMKSPIYVPGPVEPQFGPGRYIYFEGFSVDEHGKQHYLDATVAYRQTCLRVIEYLRRYGESLRRSRRGNVNHADMFFTRRLRRLPNLPPPVLCPDPGPHCGHCRHPQCLHHHCKTIHPSCLGENNPPSKTLTNRNHRACQLTSSTLTFRSTSPPRNVISAAVLSRALKMPLRSTVSKKVTEYDEREGSSTPRRNGHETGTKRAMAVCR